MTTTHLGTPRADAQGVALTPAEVDAIPTTIPRVTVDLEDDRWAWTDPGGLRRHLPTTWALPRLHGEHPVRYIEDGRQQPRGLVVLLPPTP